MSSFIIENYLFEDRFKEYRDFLRDRRYASSELGSNYRVVNHWAHIGLIQDDRLEKDKWRKFSIVDIVWVSIILELRKYGFGLDKLLNLKSSIFDLAFGSKNPSHELEFMVFLAKMKVSVSLLVYEDGLGVFIANSENFSERHIKGYLGETRDKSSFVLIDVNRLASKIFSRQDFRPYFKDLADLNNDEFELISFLRFNNYDEVRVRLNDGTITHLEGKKKIENETRIAEVIKQNSYQTIEVLVAGKNVVKIETTVKKKL